MMLTLPGARLLLGMPLSELGDGLTLTAEILGSAAIDITEHLLAAPSQEQRLAVLASAVERKFAVASPISGDLTWARARLEASAGRARVAALAAELGCSRKHLTMRFHEQFGMPPKLFARILRFDHAVRHLRADRVTSWADLACTCGYADQAHLAREFRELAGCSPTSLSRRRLPDGGFLV